MIMLLLLGQPGDPGSHVNKNLNKNDTFWYCSCYAYTIIYSSGVIFGLYP
jgi:hypothetical protein